MEVDDRPLGNAGNACPGAPTGTRWSYYHPKASFATHSQKPLASPQSIHTDMNAAMEFDNLNVAPQGPAREMTALDLVSCLTKGMANATVEVLEKFQDPATKSTTTSRVSAFDQLDHHKQSPQKEEAWAPFPEMTPRRYRGDGSQTGAGIPIASLSASPNRDPAGHPARRDVASPAHGIRQIQRKAVLKENHKVQVRIDWANSRIQKLVPKPDPLHPSFRPDPTRVTDSPPPPRMKSSIATRGLNRQHSYSTGC